MHDNLRPALWIISGMALVSISDNFVPAVSEAMGLWQLQSMRALTALPFVLVFVLVSGRLAELKPRSSWRMAVRSALSIVALLLYFAALPAVSIAQAAAGLFTSPIWVAVITIVFLREPVSVRRLASIALGFSGVCLVLGVGREPIEPMALVAVIGGLFFAMSVIWTRRQCRDERALGMAFWQFVGFLLSGFAGFAAVPLLTPLLADVPGAAFAIQGWQGMTFDTLMLVALIGLSGLVATGFIAVGYKTGEPTVVGLYDFSFLIWAPFFAWLLWGEVVDSRAVAGIVMIFAAGALASLPKRGFGKRLYPSG